MAGTPIPPKPKTMTFDDKVAPVRLFQELREPTFGMGLVGYLEMRKLMAVLFPEFQEVYDEGVDEQITRYANEQASHYSNPDQLHLDE